MSDPAPLRVASREDLAEIRALLEDCGLPPEGVEHCLDDCLLAGARGGLRACAATERCGESLLLRSLAVAAEARGRGLAATLVDALLERARAIGCGEIWLLTDSAADWFAVRGWRDQPRDAAPAGIRAHEQFRHLCPASARLMWRAL